MRRAEGEAAKDRRRRRWTVHQKERLFREFNEWGFDAKGWSHNTRYKYERRVRAADKWLTENRHLSVMFASTKDLKAYIFDTSPSSWNRNNIRQALIGFGDFLVEKGIAKVNHAKELHRLPQPYVLPKALDVEPAHLIEVAAKQYGLMTEVMVLLMLYQAMRRSEVRYLQWKQIDSGWVKFSGKGSKERSIPLTPQVIKVLGRWKARCPDPVWVFPSPRKPGQPVSGEWMLIRIREIGKLIGIHLHPHMLRHTCATRLLEVGADVRTVQEFLGHANPNTTAIYLKVRPAHLEDAVKLLNYDEGENPA